jgi:hypothetical protein
LLARSNRLITSGQPRRTRNAPLVLKPLTDDVTAYFAGFAPLVNIGR